MHRGMRYIKHLFKMKAVRLKIVDFLGHGRCSIGGLMTQPNMWCRTRRRWCTGCPRGCASGLRTSWCYVWLDYRPVLVPRTQASLLSSCHSLFHKWKHPFYTRVKHTWKLSLLFKKIHDASKITYEVCFVLFFWGGVTFSFSNFWPLCPLW